MPEKAAGAGPLAEEAGTEPETGAETRETEPETRGEEADKETEVAASEGVPRSAERTMTVYPVTRPLVTAGDSGDQVMIVSDPLKVTDRSPGAADGTGMTKKRVGDERRSRGGWMSTGFERRPPDSNPQRQTSTLVKAAIGNGPPANVPYDTFIGRDRLFGRQYRRSNQRQWSICGV